MPSLTLEPQHDPRLQGWLDGDDWVIACLCAAWCGTCTQFRAGFDALAERHPDKRFVWIDIEDRADLVGDIDVENFPTLLIQQGDAVAFFGTVLPDAKLADRLLAAQTEKSRADLLAETRSASRQAWQENCNLRRRLEDLS